MIQINPATPDQIGRLREEYRREAECQLIRYSIIPRGMADTYAVKDGDRTVGYCGVWNRYTPNRVMEFYLIPEYRDSSAEVVRDIEGQIGATEMEAQTNQRFQYQTLLAVTDKPRTENLLFEVGERTDLSVDGRFRARAPEDSGPEGDWVVETGGEVVAAGGVMLHYNPPYADIYMEVVPAFRGRGYGSFLVQKLCETASQSGRVPAARCDPDNVASFRTLLRGGMRQCGELVAGSLLDP